MTQQAQNHILEVDRSDSGVTRIAEETTSDLPDGHVRFAIDHFAITANNITYALVGDMLDYWGFFPTEAGWGRVPAMGWAEVVESNNDDIAVGGRYYGWFPMAASMSTKVTATRDGLRDDGDHRAKHAAVYRSFVRSDLDSLYPQAESDDERIDLEHRHALLRGLYITGFLAEEFFADAPDAEPYFGAEQVVVLSASSKTAIGFAHKAADRDLKVIGLTSAGNVEFVESLGIYDQVVKYDEIDTIETVPTVSIDMAGNPAVLATVHHHFGSALRYSMAVGKSHHDADLTEDQQPAAASGVQPTMFFAPTEVARRIEAWGGAGYGERVAQATADFVSHSREWLDVEIAEGIDEAESTWHEVLSGKVAPSQGRIVRPN